jgi:hypothetical protein
VHFRCGILACVLLLAGGPAGAATRLPEHVTFFTDGLKVPYFAAMKVVRLTRICVTQFSAECKDDSVRPDDLSSVDPAVFERITVLGSPSGEMLQVTDFTAWALQVQAARDAFMREYLTYEEWLVPRIAAVYEMCPEQDPARVTGLLETIRVANFGRYWQLDEAHYRRSLAQQAVEQARILKDIRKRWSPATCLQAREYAFHLVQLFASKLRPYLPNDWRQPAPRARFGMGLVWTWYSAVRAQEVVEPQAWTDAMEYGPAMPPAKPAGAPAGK